MTKAGWIGVVGALGVLAGLLGPAVEVTWVTPVRDGELEGSAVAAVAEPVTA